MEFTITTLSIEVLQVLKLGKLSEKKCVCVWEEEKSMDNFPFLCLFFNGTFPLDGIIKCNSDTELNSVSFVVPEI